MAKQTFTTGQVLTAAQMTSLQQTAMLGGAASAKTASYTLVAADSGTAISMSNASATTITVNTGLFAAGDTVQITNLGAGVCTITAGTATVNTSASLALAQYESGTLYFTSTSAAIFIKGAGAAAASGSQTLISTNTLSSTSTSINIPSGYKDVIIRAVNMQITGNNQYRLTFNSNTGSVYGFVGMNRQNTTVYTGAGSQSAMDSEGTISSSTNIQIQLYVSDYLATTRRQYTLQSSYTVSSGGANDFRSYAFLDTTAISTVQITSVGGTGTLSGTCYIIGVN